MVWQPKYYKEAIIWQQNQMTILVYHILDGIVSIILYLYQNIEEKKYTGDYGKIIRTLCEYKEVEIIEAHAMKDHIHMLVAIPPKLTVSSFMGYLKGKSSLMIFERHANLKYKYGNRNIWAKGYFVSTVGLKDEVVREYIRNQELEDMKEAQISKKEYNDPFKGAQK